VLIAAEIASKLLKLFRLVSLEACRMRLL